MSLGLLAKKVGMTQVFDNEGNRIPVTIVQSGGCVVSQIKSEASDGYVAVQVAFDDKPEKAVNRPSHGHFKKANISAKRYLREFRAQSADIAELKLGDEIASDQFKIGDKIDVTGLSRGKGFAGVMKRHNFGGANATHGTHEYFRHGGSIGCAFPQHTNKGRKMPGRMGHKRVTVQNLNVYSVEPEKNLLYIKGAVPGAKGTYLVLRKAVKHSH